MRLIYRPLPPIWPFGERTRNRRPTPFRARHSTTLELLERELRHLKVVDYVTVSAGYQESDIRLDGWPKSNARPADPAVVLSFESALGPLRYGCDQYTDHDANLRAIALTLEALRAVDRYGATRKGEQYRGFLAIGDGRTDPLAGRTDEERAAAERVISRLPEERRRRLGL